MKKLTTTIFLSILVITACSSSRWTIEYPDMPQELRDNFETALNDNLAILQDDPQNLDALFLVAFNYQQLGQLKNAEEYYLKALEIDSENVVLHNNIASIYEEVEEYDLAIEHLETIFDNDNTFSEAVNDLVRIYLKTDQPQKANDIITRFENSLQNDLKQDYDDFINGLKKDVSSYQQKHE